MEVFCITRRIQSFSRVGVIACSRSTVVYNCDVVFKTYDWQLLRCLRQVREASDAREVKLERSE
jgi:hypothetical protein